MAAGEWRAWRFRSRTPLVACASDGLDRGRAAPPPKWPDTVCCYRRSRSISSPISGIPERHALRAECSDPDVRAAGVSEYVSVPTTAFPPSFSLHKTAAKPPAAVLLHTERPTFDLGTLISEAFAPAAQSGFLSIGQISISSGPDATCICMLHQACRFLPSASVGNTMHLATADVDRLTNMPHW